MKFEPGHRDRVLLLQLKQIVTARYPTINALSPHIKTKPSKENAIC